MIIQVLMPMAGLGSRFQNEGVTILKPLIKVGDCPMYKRAIHSLLVDGLELSLFFVIKDQDQINHQFGDCLKNDFPKAKIIMLPQMTRGSLETCYQSASFLDFSLPLVILDCDFEFKSQDFISYMQTSTPEHAAGALVSFDSQNPRYSYARIENEEVIETAEKKVISSHALAGAYYFTRAKYFFDEASEVLKESSEMTSEINFYIAPLYNRLLKKDKIIKFFKLDQYKSFGTPEELQMSGYK